MSSVTGLCLYQVNDVFSSLELSHAHRVVLFLPAPRQEWYLILNVRKFYLKTFFPILLLCMRNRWN